MPQCNGEDFVAWSRVEAVDRRGCRPNAAAIGFLLTGQPDGAATGRNARIPPALGASVKEICELFEINRLFKVEPPAGRQNARPPQNKLSCSARPCTAEAIPPASK